ncbi:MAG: hypothetical protein RBT05_09175 [Bacteroidales bacterium]|nr:hypothetical protein [Bacteroidales bacterium]
MGEDSEEGAMIASSDSIKIEIESFKTEFAPGVGNLELKYNLSESSKQIVEKYPNEDFKIHFAIADKKNDIVYKLTEDANKEGTFIWNGYMNDNKSDSITYENGPYKLATTVTLGNVGINKWQDIKDFAYELIFSDSVRVISHSIDTSFNILTGANLEWLANEDMQGYVINDENEKPFDAYKRVREIYMSYEGVKEAGDPFKYIAQNTKQVEFLGKDLKVHKEFAIVLETVKSTLKTKGVYDALKTKYASKYVGTFAMRTVNDPNGDDKVSEHGFAMAVDIYPKGNPQITRSNTKKRPYNTYVRAFIKLSTGLDIGTPKTKTGVKDAQNKFLTTFNTTYITALANEYKAIYDYNSNADNIKIDSLSVINQILNNLKTTYNALSSQSDESSINTVKTNAENFAVKIKALSEHIIMHKNTLVFDNITNTQIDELTNKLSIIYSELSSVIDSLNNKTFGNITDITVLSASDYKDMEAKVASFFTEQKKLCPALDIFADRLKSGIEAIGFNNILLQDGFCDLEIDLIDAFLGADERIQWGGIFNEKIDGMHFGFTSDAAKNIVNNK